MSTVTGSEQDLVVRLRDGVIRLVLGLGLALLCYRFFAPFIGLMAWGLILAVTLYPAQQLIARRVGGRQGLAATLLVVLGLVLVVAPSSVLVGSLGDSVQTSVQDVKAGKLAIPAPGESVAKLADRRREAAFGLVAGARRPALAPQGRRAAGRRSSRRPGSGFLAGIGGGLMLLLAAFIVAGIIMAYGEAGDRGCQAIFARLFGPVRGSKLAHLSVATIRAVALGVLGVALIQAIIIGLCLLVAGVPWAGVLAIIVLLLGIVQVPALVVTLPAIAWIWWTGDYATGPPSPIPCCSWSRGCPTTSSSRCSWAAASRRPCR